MKNMYSFWAIFCLFTLFVVSCSKDDETTDPVGTKTSTNQTGTSTKTTQTGTTHLPPLKQARLLALPKRVPTPSTTQTSTTTNTTQTAIVEVIVSGEVNGINLKVTDAPANQNP